MIDITDFSIYWTAGVLLAFLFDWICVAFKWRRIEFISKPLAMLLVILWTLNAIGWEIHGLLILLVLAQAFGLVGDILLMQSEHWFIGGLSAFLIGHLLFNSLLAIIIRDSFLPGLSGFQLAWRLLVVLILWALILLYFYKTFKPLSVGKSISMRLWEAIQLYGWILSGLVVLAIFTILVIPEFSWLSLTLPVGAFLFLISDMLLSYNRFVKPINNAKLWVRISYHLAQFGLAVGFLTVLKA